MRRLWMSKSIRIRTAGEYVSQGIAIAAFQSVFFSFQIFDAEGSITPSMRQIARSGTSIRASLVIGAG